jgi:hypothetical protein
VIGVANPLTSSMAKAGIARNAEMTFVFPALVTGMMTMGYVINASTRT